MVVGIPPFYHENQSVMFDSIIADELKVPHFISAELKYLLTNLLKKSPDERISDATDAMNHKWFSSINFDDLMNKKIEPSFKPSRR